MGTCDYLERYLVLESLDGVLKQTFKFKFTLACVFFFILFSGSRWIPAPNEWNRLEGHQVFMGYTITATICFHYSLSADTFLSMHDLYEKVFKKCR